MPKLTDEQREQRKRAHAERVANSPEAMWTDFGPRDSFCKLFLEEGVRGLLSIETCKDRESTVCKRTMRMSDLLEMGEFISALAARYNSMVQEANGNAAACRLEELQCISKK